MQPLDSIGEGVGGGTAPRHRTRHRRARHRRHRRHRTPLITPGTAWVQCRAPVIKGTRVAVGVWHFYHYPRYNHQVAKSGGPPERGARHHVQSILPH